MIGAHSLVNRDVPDWCLAVGAPARVKEYFGPPELRPVGIET
jgi:acetyltransferase-like isoleucine patch superfamily enzyme